VPRLFVALADIPVWAELERLIASAIADLPGARPTPQAYRHVTLAFIGDVPQAMVAAIEGAMAGVAASAHAEGYALDRLGGFPRPEARIVALTGATPQGLGRLALDLADRLRAAGIAVERRPLRMHVTVARLRENRLIATQFVPPLRVMAEEIRLYESELLPAGARYHLVSRFALPHGDGASA
jgi:2'-5' RNA ligase